MLLAGACVQADPNSNPPQLVPASGKFSPDWKSLEQYQTPEWFRDAKFGIWAHWSAQCVPEKGDWYGARLYKSNDPRTGKPDGDYTYHVATYGHPSKFGMKDIDHLWHAENWDPEKLIALYKKAGAKYFVALANHHDNFDCYDSTYQPWNSVNIGPKKDIVGGWAKAARAAVLRFGVSVHASHAWVFYEYAQGWPEDGKLVVKSLADKSVQYPGAIGSVTLLGSSGRNRRLIYTPVISDEEKTVKWENL